MGKTPKKFANLREIKNGIVAPEWASIKETLPYGSNRNVLRSNVERRPIDTTTPAATCAEKAL